MLKKHKKLYFVIATACIFLAGCGFMSEKTTQSSPETTDEAVKTGTETAEYKHSTEESAVKETNGETETEKETQNAGYSANSDAKLIDIGPDERIVVPGLNPHNNFVLLDSSLKTDREYTGFNIVSSDSEYIMDISTPVVVSVSSLNNEDTGYGLYDFKNDRFIIDADYSDMSLIKEINGFYILNIVDNDKLYHKIISSDDFRVIREGNGSVYCIGGHIWILSDNGRFIDILDEECRIIKTIEFESRCLYFDQYSTEEPESQTSPVTVFFDVDQYVYTVNGDVILDEKGWNEIVATIRNDTGLDVGRDDVELRRCGTNSLISVSTPYGYFIYNRNRHMIVGELSQDDISFCNIISGKNVDYYEVKTKAGDNLLFDENGYELHDKEGNVFTGSLSMDTFYFIDHNRLEICDISDMSVKEFSIPSLKKDSYLYIDGKNWLHVDNDLDHYYLSLLTETGFCGETIYAERATYKSDEYCFIMLKTYSNDLDGLKSKLTQNTENYYLDSGAYLADVSGNVLWKGLAEDRPTAAGENFIILQRGNYFVIMDYEGNYLYKKLLPGYSDD